MSCAELPVRKISSQANLDEFLASPTFNKFTNFINSLGDSVKGLPLSSIPSSLPPNVEWAVKLLREMREKVKEYPAHATNSRFGNHAFREWLDCCRRWVPQRHGDIKIPFSTEVTSYLLNSLGDHKRIDYGTGHEAHFAAWLYCLFDGQTGPFFHPHQMSLVVMTVFAEYISLMRLLQLTYWLEPAGSHGVWGLDDYHFLPFLLGAHQLVGHAHLKPKSIHERELVEELAKEYFYFQCINNINQVKQSATLRWHSPILDDISAVKSWEKVAGGLGKMYRVEVMGKVPIMQHFLFGKILPFEPTTTTADSMSSLNDQIHRHSIQGDCCGNPLPSIFAAAADSCAHRDLPKLPFD